MVKRYEELTISDDFMFGKAMGDKVASRSGWICIRGIKSECTMQNRRKYRRICGSYMIISEAGRSEET